MLDDSKPNLIGILVVDKPPGCSSMDVVRVVKKAAGKVKTGHAGTLDPLASGVVICCLGREATRLSEMLMAMGKVYHATVDLSAFSTTDDAEGQVTAVPERPAGPPTEDEVLAVLASLTGHIQQVPPAHSAVFIDGTRAYKLARRGVEFDMPSRIVRIDAIKLFRYAWPELDIVVHCGKGTYIRSLARQIGVALGCGGYLTALRRTQVGSYHVDHATPLDDVPVRLSQADLLPLPQQHDEA